MEEYLKTIRNPEHRARIREILEWVVRTFPQLRYETRWNQPMFTEHGAYMIGFSAAKDHLSISPEPKGMERFSAAIAKAGYTQTPNLFRIPWKEPVNYELLECIIRYNIEDKAYSQTFWRKRDE